MALDYKKHKNYDWTFHLVTSLEVGIKYIHPELSNLIDRFESIMVHIIYIYTIYLFHPRYLHNGIFRYMTPEITQDISSCGHGVPCSLPCSTGLEQLLKYQLVVWVAPKTKY